METEITFELTNFCREGCRFCSSETTDNQQKAMWLSIEDVREHLAGRRFDHIILSGGEPLAHPHFYRIFEECEQHTSDVVVYSNLIRHRVYNAHAIDGVYLEARVTPSPGTNRVGILRRVEQGREARRPEVTFSRNHDGPCECDHRVIRPDGSVGLHPCHKAGQDEDN